MIIARNAKTEKPKRAQTLNEAQIQHFVENAPDDIFLVEKIGLLIGCFASTRPSELVRLKNSDVRVLACGETHINLSNGRKTDQAARGQLFIAPATGWASPSKLILTYNMKKRESGKEGPCDPNSRFFWHMRNGRVVDSVVGRNWVGVFCKRVAEFLFLDPKEISGYTVRRSSITAMAEGGATPQQLRVQGGWKRDSIASVYVAQTESFARNNGQAMFRTNSLQTPVMPEGGSAPSSIPSAIPSAVPSAIPQAVPSAFPSVIPGIAGYHPQQISSYNTNTFNRTGVSVNGPVGEITVQRSSNSDEDFEEDIPVVRRNVASAKRASRAQNNAPKRKRTQEPHPE
jgi:hypothetical protein